MAYPMEIFKDGESRVMFGPEEHAEAKKDGWSDEREELSTMQEIAADMRAGTFPKRRGRPPMVRINEVA